MQIKIHVNQLPESPPNQVKYPKMTAAFLSLFVSVMKYIWIGITKFIEPKSI
uniref:Uncharacterized protein n=1 Tax=Rhizophora mucronata TaxID=61149 RepID=A0A2P2PYJ0_RHIMU